MGDFDRISMLPDEILHQILSSLPATRDAVRTSILSKRWRNLYLSVSSLSISTVDFTEKDSKRKLSLLQYDSERLQLFLGRMLPHLESSTIHMQALHLSLCRDRRLDESLFAKCLLVAAKRSIQHLHLSYFPGKIPPCVFASQSLVTLRLCFCRIDAEDLNTACLLRRLTTLHLFYMRFGMSAAAKFISGCPALRHLTMISCFVDGGLDISSQTLQTLNLTSTNFYGIVSVSASALLSFDLNMVKARACTLRGLSSLVRLSIDAWSAVYYPLGVLEALHNVQELKLGPRVLKILFGKIIALGQLPTVLRLKKLELNTYLGSGPIQAITCVLQCFPSLEELVIRRCEGYRFYRKSIVPSEPSEEFLGNLKLLKLHGYPCDKSEKVTQGFINSLLADAKGPEKKLIAKLFENYIL